MHHTEQRVVIQSSNLVVMLSPLIAIYKEFKWLKVRSQSHEVNMSPLEEKSIEFCNNTGAKV